MQTDEQYTRRAFAFDVGMRNKAMAAGWRDDAGVIHLDILEHIDLFTVEPFLAIHALTIRAQTWIRYRMDLARRVGIEWQADQGQMGRMTGMAYALAAVLMLVCNVPAERIVWVMPNLKYTDKPRTITTDAGKRSWMICEVYPNVPPHWQAYMDNLPEGKNDVCAAILLLRAVLTRSTLERPPSVPTTPSSFGHRRTTSGSPRAARRK